MAPTVIIIADGLTGAGLTVMLGSAAAPLAAAFVHDTVSLARSLRGVRVVVCPCPALPPEALDGLGPEMIVAPLAGSSAVELSAALAGCFEAGEPVLLISPGLPHLPVSRLRDALTHFEEGADLVLGPTDRSGWYLLGLRAPDPELLQLIPGAHKPVRGLIDTSRRFGRRLSVLPPWFTVSAPEDFVALAEVLRPLPPTYAPVTRALLEDGVGLARAVGG